jgi:hypothetical protein
MACLEQPWDEGLDERGLSRAHGSADADARDARRARLVDNVMRVVVVVVFNHRETVLSQLANRRSSASSWHIAITSSVGVQLEI